MMCDSSPKHLYLALAPNKTNESAMEHPVICKITAQHHLFSGVETIHIFNGVLAAEDGKTVDVRVLIAY